MLTNDKPMKVKIGKISLKSSQILLILTVSNYLFITDVHHARKNNESTVEDNKGHYHSGQNFSCT